MADPNTESDYALAGGKSGVNSAKLGSKEGSTREGSRGGSEDTVGGGQKEVSNPGYAFFGDASGRNEDTFHKPEIKAPTKPSLMEGD